MTSSHLIDSLGWTLLHFTWQGALVGALTAALLGAMSGARAEHRYLVACSALLACLLWPTLELVQRLAQGPMAHQVTLLSGPLQGLVEARPGASFSQQLQQRLGIIVALWALCATALSLRLGLGLFWIDQIGQRAGKRAPQPWQQRLDQMASQFAIARCVELRIVQHLASPVTAGWWKPVILVPASLISGMPADLLEALLAHELGHIKRHDYLVNLVQHTIEIVLFYHPAVWWISRQVRNEREKIADDLAARQLGEPRRLALALSELEKLQFSTQHLAQAANGGDLMLRIKRLLRPDTRASNWTAVIPVMTLATLTLAACGTVAAPSEQGKALMDDVKVAVVDFKTCSKPKWPAEDLRLEHTGTVVLSFDISSEGSVMDGWVKKSSGHPNLDQAALEGIKLCQFKPGTLNGKPVRSGMNMQYVWLLN